MNNTKNSLPPERQTASGGAKRGGMGCSIALALLLVALVAAAVIGTPRLLRFFDTRSEVAPLSADASEQVQKLGEERSKEQEQLNQYSWIDKSAGVARIPIARAIALIAAQGLPVGIPPTPTLAPADAISATAEVTATAPAVDLEHLDFAKDVLPIFEAHCTKCHGGDNPEEGLELTSRKKILAGSLNGSVVKPGDPENSYLVDMITSNKMPKKGPPLSQNEKDIIIAWIKAGAPDSPTSSAAPSTTNAVSATTTLSGTAGVSASTALSESAAVSTTTVASPTLDLSKVELNNIHFSTDVLPIFEAHCFKCHGDIDNPEEGLQLTSRKKIMAGSLNGSVVKPGDPDNSYLVKMIVEKKMPKRGAPLSQLEIDIIIAWIKAGALDDSPSNASASSTVTKTTTVSNTEQVTSTVAAAKPTTTVTATLVANTSETVTATATVSATKLVSATPTKAAATNTSTPDATATAATTVTPAATITATPAATATQAVTKSVIVTATTATTTTTSATPISETVTISSTFDPSKVDLNNVSFKDDVLPIFEQHCFKCHGDIENPEEGLQLTSRKKVMAGSLNGGVVSPGDPDKSYLVEMITKNKMPKKGPPLSQLEKDIIIAWIKQGALDN
ncbi:MAG: c-type cytochrome domain-containing protein [Caldilineaceae bacterium]